ncbi:MAG: molybdopterin-guanine dinucleotide biosynthesis protein B [Deltaproteobacteria bacterium]|nr:molybdopterin-guanine dinucleotide biosynthesis protein B [Deltaproteobacteria bacterium]
MTQLISFVGRSNSGKTTLLIKLLPLFVARGTKVATIKNTHHQVEFDQPGKDSYRHRQAGAEQVLLVSEEDFCLIGKRENKLNLDQLVERYFIDFDLVISEGFKNEKSLKVEVYRSETGKTPLYRSQDYQIDALISNENPALEIPIFDLNDVEGIYDWICEKLAL